jgi:phospholipid/cholesterol/gamma-HCH transport system substrate-binding protein
LARVERGEGFLGRMTSSGKSSDEIDSLVLSSRHLITGLNDAQKRLIHSIDAAQASFDSLSNGVLHGGGTLSRLVWDSTLYTEMTSMSRRINSLAARLDSDNGTLGKLTTDSTMYVEIRRLVIETRTLLDDLRANPKKYFKFSVF